MLDNNGGDGGDFELISQHRDQNPQICQKPKAIDYKTQRNCSLMLLYKSLM